MYKLVLLYICGLWAGDIGDTDKCGQWDNHALCQSRIIT